MSFLKLVYDLVWVSSDVTTANLVSTCLPNGERAPKLCAALPRRRGSRSSAIFIYDVNKPLNGRITSAVAVCALLGHDGSDAAALRRSGRAAELQQCDINHAHAHKFTMSLPLSARIVLLACTRLLGIAPSRSQCFIAAGNGLLLACSSSAC